jgi:hypothetical protein
VPTPLVPAAELAKRNTMTFPNESADYRQARRALLAEEIELRRHIERVAEQRRALPPVAWVTASIIRCSGSIAIIRIRSGSTPPSWPQAMPRSMLSMLPP